MPRRQLTLYLGPRESEAFDRCPPGIRRGRWINMLVAQLLTWSDDQWKTLHTHIATRPPRASMVGKLSIAIPSDSAAQIERRCPTATLTDVVRTLLLRAAHVPFEAIPLPVPWTQAPASSPPDRTPDFEPAWSAEQPMSSHALPATPPLLPSTPPVPSAPLRAWKVVEPDDDDVQLFEDRCAGRDFDADISAPDLTPALSVELMVWLANAEVGEDLSRLLGVAHDDDGDSFPIAIESPDATEVAFQAICDATMVSYRGSVMRFEWGDEPGEVCLLFQIERM